MTVLLSSSCGAQKNSSGLQTHATVKILGRGRQEHSKIRTLRPSSLLLRLTSLSLNFISKKSASVFGS